MRLRESSCDSERDRLAQRGAKLAGKLFGVMQRNALLEEENARLRVKVARLREENPRLCGSRTAAHRIC